MQFAYDAAGRLTTQTLSDGRVITSTYDANGNVVSVTPPSRPAHTFTYTPLDLEGSYDPPDVGAAPDSTTYGYNLDRQPTTITRPDGTTVTLNYDPGSRLSTLTLPRGPLTYTYHPTTGNLTSIAAPDGGTLTYSYNGSLLTGTAWGGPVAGTVSHTYDADFRLATESVNAASPVAFTYDPDSRGHPHRCLGHRGHGGEGGRSLAVGGGGRADEFRRSGAGARGRCPRCPP